MAMKMYKYKVVGTEGKCSHGTHAFAIGDIVQVAPNQTNYRGDVIEAEACVFRCVEGSEVGLDQGLLWTDVEGVA